MKNNSKKIAIIEDEVTIASMYDIKLKLHGYKTAVAYNGEEGLKVIKAFKPDLILLDLRMPVMNGQDMLEKLRSFDWAKNLRVIILTNISRDEAPKSLQFLNVDRYIVKAHHTPKQVIEIIEEVLG